jgi:hypothetical protein
MQTYMESKKSKEFPRATREDAERLDWLNAEIERLKSANDESSKEQWLKLSAEYDNMIWKYDWRDEVFEENGKKGLKDVKGDIVVPAIYDDFCMPEKYFMKELPVGAQKDGKVALVKRDGKGTPCSPFDSHYVERIPFSAVYAEWKSDDLKHFALRIGSTAFTPHELEWYGQVRNGCVLLGANGKMGVLAIDQGLVYIAPEYDSVIEGGYGDDYTFVKDGKKGRVTLEKRFVSDEEFSKLSDEEQDELVFDIGFVGSEDNFPF